MTQLIKGYDRSICNRNRKFNSACDPSKKLKLTVSVCSQNNSEFGTFGHRLGLGMHKVWNSLFRVRCQRLNLKSGTSFSKNKPLKLNSEHPKPQTVFRPKLHPKVRCILITHKKSSIIGVQSFTFFLKTYLLQDTNRFSSFNRKFP